MLGMFDVAKTVCELAGWNLSHLKLQKIMYILQMFYLGEKGRPLFYANFEAWDFGPVEPNLYKKLRAAGADNIPRWLFILEDTISRDDPDYEFIEDLTNTLLEKSPSFLVNYVHDSKSAWRKVYKKDEKHIPITNEDIRGEYERR